MTQDSLLTVDDLKTYFFTSSGVVKAVDGVSFSIGKGARVGIAGESGSGKSVMSLSLLRLISPPGKIVGGRILLNEAVDLLASPEADMRKIRGAQIAMVFQEPMSSLNPVFTVGNQIEEAVALHQHNISRQEQKEKVLESLRLVGIPDPKRLAASYPHELSGGMRQRVMIAMALSCHPALLIADEPTTALDVTVQAQVMALLNELQQTLQMSFLLITHDLSLLSESVDEVLVMYAGRVVEQAPVKDLFKSPRHPYTRALIRSAPSLDMGHPLPVIPGSVPDLSKLPVGCHYQDRCEKVQKKCLENDPALTETVPGHQAACFFPYVAG